MTTTRPSTRTSSELAARLRLVVTRLSRQLRQRAEIGISPTQMSALAAIERHGSMTLGELAAHERVQPPSITAVVTRLEEQGLVARRPDPNDRRVARVEATRDGHKLVARSRSRKDAELDRRLRALTDDERATLADATEILERLVEAEQEPD
ncbi:MAG TPA: MarR family transcriptional regulator [Acidimicrobiia bacterium]|nr:MarR family transcriptional regulator [Acidimicrobiia bacterium]